MKKFLFFISFSIIMLFPINAADRHIGMCLAGGGSVSAYQVGVWLYLNESGIVNQIKSISGSAVGSWNAALFACHSPADVKRIWTSLPDDFTMAVDIGLVGMLSNATGDFAETMGQIYEANKSNINDKSQMFLTTTKEVASIGAREISSFIKDSFWKYVGTQDKVEGLYERDEFASLVKKEISLDKIKNAPFNIYVSAVRKEKLAVKTVSKLFSEATVQFCLADQNSADDICDIILASSATPFAFTTQTLSENVIAYDNGKSKKIGKKYEYLDGSFELVGGKTYNLKPLLDDKNIYEIIVVYLQSKRELGRTRLKTDEINKNITEIIPSVDLSAFVSKESKMTKAKIAQLIQLGYTDAKALYDNKTEDKK